MDWSYITDSTWLFNLLPKDLIQHGFKCIGNVFKGGSASVWDYLCGMLSVIMVMLLHVVSSGLKLTLIFSPIILIIIMFNFNKITKPMNNRTPNTNRNKNIM